MKRITKVEQLKTWMKRKKVFSSADVIKKGLDMYYIRADRTKRDLLEQGLIRPLTDRELKRRKIKTTQRYYKWVG